MVTLYAEYPSASIRPYWQMLNPTGCHSSTYRASAFKVRTTKPYIIEWARQLKEAGIPLTIYNFKKYHTIVYRGNYTKMVLFLFRPIFSTNYTEYLTRSEHKFITLLAILCVNSRSRNGTYRIPDRTTFEELTKVFDPLKVSESFSGKIPLNYRHDIEDYERILLSIHNKKHKK